MTNASNAVSNIDHAWAEVEKSIHALGEVVKQVTTNEDSTGRYEGYRATLSIIMDNYLNHIYADRDRPEYLPWLGALTNYGGPSPDFRYGMVQLRPNVAYRVWGSRGDAELIDFQQFSGWHGLKSGFKGSPSQYTFESQNIHVDEQGRFEFTMSPDKPAHGDWWKLETDVTTIAIREFFTAPTQREPAVFHFERIDFKDTGTTIVTADEAADRLNALAKSMQDWIFTIRFAENYAKVGDNRFHEDAKVTNDKSGQIDQRFMLMRFNIQPGQALIGEWKIPKECRYWDFSALSDHLQLFNHGYRQISLNKATAHVGDDGYFRFVMSHQDPLVANWLDMDGHSVGIVIGRAKQCSGSDIPSVKIVPEADILKHLPKEIKMVTLEERAANIALRRDVYRARERR